MIATNKLFAIHLFLASAIQASSVCDRSCPSDGKIKVPYPFGFTSDCEIPLNCSQGIPQIGKFKARVTSQGILVHIPASCSRSIESLMPLFGLNYRPILNTGFLLQNCTVPPDCRIPLFLMASQVEIPCGGAYCYSNSSYYDYSDLEKSSCKSVLAPFSIVNNMDRTVSLEFERVYLDWWMEGRCNCAPNANCISAEDGREGYRCKCRTGWKGDGFEAGEGCRKIKTVEHTHSITTHTHSITIQGTAILIAVVIALGIFYFMFLIVADNDTVSDFVSCWRNRLVHPTYVAELLESYGCHSLQRYRFSDIIKMTNLFEEILGRGGYGIVFKGKLPSGRLVAVKILNDSKGNGDDFVNEVATIGTTNHVNVVSLVGFSIEGNKRALVYEYMTNGSLERFIYLGKKSCMNSPYSLGWEKLYQIALGIARGLEYLHTGCNTRILHFDIKPHNILLDKDFIPKISDFGLAKICPKRESIVSVACARGTIGYIAPELCCRDYGAVSPKSDVYSYGMMVLEMIGGRKNFNASVEILSEIYFPQWIYNRLNQNGKVQEQDEIIEQGLKEIFDNETAKKMIMVALWCIQTHAVDRPSMSKVVEMLEGDVHKLPMPQDPSFEFSSSFH